MKITSGSVTGPYEEQGCVHSDSFAQPGDHLQYLSLENLMLVLFLSEIRKSNQALRKKILRLTYIRYDPVLHPFCFRVDDPDELRDLQADPWDAGQKFKKHQEAHQIKSNSQNKNL